MLHRIAHFIKACVNARMAFKINYHGIEITANSANEAASLARDLAGTAPIARPLGRPPKQKTEIQESGDQGISLLEAIKVAGAAGIDTEDAARIARAGNTKAMGGISMKLNNRIRRAGFDIHDGYDNSRPIDGTERRWKAGSKIAEVISALRAGIDDIEVGAR